MRLQQAIASARGFGLASSEGDIPFEYFDAIAEDQEEAATLEFETNAQRAISRIKSDWRK